MCAVILSRRDMGANKSCEPTDGAVIAEGELAGSDLRGVYEVKPKYWTFNRPLLISEEKIYIATVTYRQRTPRNGKAIIYYTEAQDEA